MVCTFLRRAGERESKWRLEDALRRLLIEMHKAQYMCKIIFIAQNTGSVK